MGVYLKSKLIDYIKRDFKVFQRDFNLESLTLKRDFNFKVFQRDFNLESLTLKRDFNFKVFQRDFNLESLTLKRDFNFKVFQRDFNLTASSDLSLLCHLSSLIKTNYSCEKRPYT